MADSNKEVKVSFLKGLKAEYKKIIWPNREELIKQTIAVSITSLLLGALIAILDLGFKTGLSFIIK